jgi:hypothetical protein
MYFLDKRNEKLAEVIESKSSMNDHQERENEIENFLKSLKSKNNIIILLNLFFVILLT